MRGRDIFLACDYDACGEEIHADHGWDTFDELIAMARSCGWSVGKAELCPDHRRMSHNLAAENAKPFVDRNDGLEPNLGY